MRQLMLYGSATLPPYAPTSKPAQAAITAALLLYPETIHLVRLCDSYEIFRSCRHEIASTLDRIETEHGSSLIEQWLAGKLPEDARLGYYERTLLRCFYATSSQWAFQSSYQSLLNAGVIVSTNVSATQSDIPAWRYLGQLLDKKRHEIFNAFKGIRMRDLLAGCSLENYVPAALARVESMRAHGTAQSRRAWEYAFVKTTARAAQDRHDAMGRLMELLCQEMVAGLGEFATVTTSQLDLAIHRRMSRIVQRHLKCSMAEPASSRTIATNLLSTVFLSLPTALPRTLDAILEVRCALKEVLGDFRMHLDDLAHDLVYLDKVRQRDIDYAVRKHLARPAQEIAKQLARPGRAVGRNLMTSSAIISGAVSFGTAVVSGATVVVCWFGVNVTARVEHYAPKRCAV